jgi:alpha-N-arabinofuranosidase
MDRTTITLSPEFQIAPIDQRLFGGFLEHIGRAVYEGVYDPKSGQADRNGFRKDVLGALKDLSFTAMRYPGGNFASGYHWLDGVGPLTQRLTNYEPASQSLEPNQFGTDEFMQLARVMGWQPMLTVNLGTGSPEEARNWLEYCNRPRGARYSDLRASNGSPDPYHVKLWCLGNEMDGPWQLGHVPAERYAVLAQQTARMMKYTDPSVEVVVCGSCETGLPTYLDWDRTVLEYVGEDADYISLHQYVGRGQGDTADYLAVTNAIDRHIEEMDAVCRLVQGRRRSRKRAFLAFDEWNVWYRTQNAESVNGHGKVAQHLVEEEYNLEDALVVAGFLNSFLRHADVIKIANLAQIVNVIAPILTRQDMILLQSIYYPLLLYAGCREGIALLPAVHGPGYESPSHGYVHFIDTSAVLQDGQLQVFLVNRRTDELTNVEIHTPGLELVKVLSAEVVTGPSAEAVNTFEKPGIIRSRKLTGIRLGAGSASLRLPPLSVASVRFGLQV